MKNIFGLNKTMYSDIGTEDFDGACFISRSLEGEATVKEQEKPAAPKLPVPLSILQYLFVAAFAIGLGLWVYSGMAMAEAFKTAIYIPLLLFVGFVGFVALSIVEMIQSKKFAKEMGLDSISDLDDYENIHDTDEDAEQAEEARVKAELGIPEDAVDIDFLSFFYRENENGPFPIKPFDFMTLEMFAFSDEEALHIADYNDVYSINKSDIKEIEKIEKEATLLGWSKDEAFDSEKYAEFDIKENDEGFIVIPYYYSVSISKDDEEFELVIPPYEIDTLKSLI